MSDSPADSVMATPNPPGRGGACGAVNTPAPLFYSARHEQRAAEQDQRVGDRWTIGPYGWALTRAPSAPETTTGKADAATDCLAACDCQQRAVRTPDSADAAKPTLKPYWRKPLWWRWV